jgi:hypothetical protein
VIVLHPHAKEIVIGKGKLPSFPLADILRPLFCLVITMYTTSAARNAQHQWVPSITSVGMPSYVNIQVYRAFSGDTFSSLLCSSLGCNTYLRVPRTHLLFSLASCPVSRTENQTPAGQSYVLITPSPFAVGKLKLLQVKVNEIYMLVRELKRMLKGKALAPHNDTKDIESTDSEGED